MTQDEFEKTIKSFDGTESMRGKIYYSALNLIRADFVIEAHILLLSTWNFAGFRYVIPTFDISAYEALVRNITYQLQPLLNADFSTVNLDAHRQLIIDLFDRLAAVKGIGSTGAAKILHLLSPSVFVMWDRSISGWHSPIKDYGDLEVVRSGFWNPPKLRFDLSGVGYYDFLIFCQNRFRGLVSPSPRKTLAKCIDEFNYCTITKLFPPRRVHRNERKV
jgi:hypothetical protein